jgi:hypothetical protein
LHKKKNSRAISTQPQTVTKQQPIYVESDEEDTGPIGEVFKIVKRQKVKGQTPPSKASGQIMEKTMTPIDLRYLQHENNNFHSLWMEKRTMIE